MTSIFKIRRSEWIPVLLAGVVFIGLNVMMTGYQNELFTRGGRLGFWSIFWNHFHVSGFDPTSYLEISQWNSYYKEFRHPLLPFFWYPFSVLDSWLMKATETNYAIYMVACVQVFCAIYSFVFLRRTLLEVIEVPDADANLLSAFFYSFAYIILAVMVPDHFGMSLFLLTMTLYITGIHMKEKKPMKILPWAILFLCTAGVTLSNGIKTLWAACFTEGKKVLRPAFLFFVVVIPLALLAGSYAWQYQHLILPRMERGKKIQLAMEKKDSTFKKKEASFGHRFQQVHGKAISDKGPLQWTNLSTPRWQSIRDNLLGESIQLHSRHLLEDVFFTRPIFVSYAHPYQDGIELLVALLFAAGLWCGRHSRFLWMVGTWFGFDLFLHLGLGFGLNEVYIMAAHWAFIIPLAIAFLFKKIPLPYHKALRVAIACLTVYLWVYNVNLISHYLLHTPLFFG